MIRMRLLLACLACLAAALPASAAERLPVVATFSILGDLVRAVGGDRVAVTTLVGPDSDAHVFSPSPADARRLADAKLVVANGLGLEGWIPRLVRSSGTTAALVETARDVVARRLDEPGAGHGGAARDPHAWQDVANAKRYVHSIRDALAAASPADRAVFEANAATYLTALDALDTEIRGAWAGIPRERRRIITTHDAFGYYGAAYGVEFLAAQGVSTETEASAQDVARIIRQIRREKVPAVFLETIADPRLAERIASETGARIGPRVYSDALSGPDGPAPTYLAMMRYNLRAFTAALAP